MGFNSVETSNGVPVLDRRGYALDERDPAKGYVSGGTWNRVDKAERWACLAQKG